MDLWICEFIYLTLEQFLAPLWIYGFMDSWIYISDTDQAKISSVLVPAACLEARRPRRPTSSRPDMVLGQLKKLQCTCMYLQPAWRQGGPGGPPAVGLTWSWASPTRPQSCTLPPHCIL
jgi:hypothetical protein